MKTYYLIDKINSVIIQDLISALKNYPEFRNIEKIVFTGLQSDIEIKLTRGVSFYIFKKKFIEPGQKDKKPQKVSIFVFNKFKRRMLAIIDIVKDKYKFYGLDRYRNIFEKDFQIVDSRRKIISQKSDLINNLNKTESINKSSAGNDPTKFYGLSRYNSRKRKIVKEARIAKRAKLISEIKEIDDSNKEQEEFEKKMDLIKCENRDRFANDLAFEKSNRIALQDSLGKLNKTPLSIVTDLGIIQASRVLEEMNRPFKMLEEMNRPFLGIIQALRVLEEMNRTKKAIEDAERFSFLCITKEADRCSFRSAI